MNSIKIKSFLPFILICIFFVGCGSNENVSVDVSKDVKNEVINRQSNVDDMTLASNKNESDNNAAKYDEEKSYLVGLKGDGYLCSILENDKIVVPHAYYDIDNDEIDELIIKKDSSLFVCSIYNGEFKCIASNKYGDDFIIFPEKKAFYWTGGHKDYRNEEYICIDKGSGKMLAERKWEINKKKQTFITSYCKIDNKKCNEKEYNKYVSSINKGKIINEKDINWIVK